MLHVLPERRLCNPLLEINLEIFVGQTLTRTTLVTFRSSRRCTRRISQGGKSHAAYETKVASSGAPNWAARICVYKI